MEITDTIDPKVDQLTADHLIGRTLTIRVTGVRLAAGEQPCEIQYDGDNGLPYRPGKSMRRVLVHAWGGDVAKYAGRRMTLYRDDDVQFGGLKVGGIRISHMSDIAQPLTLALTAKKGSKKAFKVLPMPAETSQRAEPERAPWVGMAWPICDRRGGCVDLGDVDAWQAELEKRVAAVRALDLPDAKKSATLAQMAEANRGAWEDLAGRGYEDAARAAAALFAANGEVGDE